MTEVLLGADRIRNLLVFRTGHLGDTLVSLPAFWQLRRHFEGARLTLLANQDVKNPGYLSPINILPKDGLFDEFLSYPSNISSIGAKLQLAKVFARLRSGRYDAIAYLMTRFRKREQIERDLRFFRLAGIRVVIGAKYLLDNLIDLALVDPSKPIVSESQFFVDCLEADRVPISDDVPDPLLIREEEKFAASEWLRSAAGSGIGDRRWVAIGPGSKWPSKVWNHEKYLRVVRKLIDEFDIHPLILGGPEDAEIGNHLTARWGRGSVAAGRLNVRESAAILQNCDLYLGNDTGTMHLAAAVSTPCVSIFAAIDVAGRWDPIGEQNINFRRDVECSGCHTPICFNNHKCLELISEDEVTIACVKSLATTTPRNPFSGR